MADRPRDLWDVLQNLQSLVTPVIDAAGEVLDALQTGSDTIVMSDSAPTLPYLHHTGVYTWGGGLPLGLADDPATIWGRFQWG